MSLSNHSLPGLVVLISGSGTNLQAIIDAIGDGRIRAEIRCVISNRADAYGLERARNAGIPCQVLDHRAFDSREAFDRALAEIIDAHNPDLVVLAGFMRILTQGFVRHYQGRLLNIHPSLLPKYRGLDTHQRALDAGDCEHGVTVHFVTEELDGGPNLIQAVVPVLPGDTAALLRERVLRQEHVIYPQAIAWFLEGRVRMQDNQALLDGEPLPPCGVQIREDIASAPLAG